MFPQKSLTSFKLLALVPSVLRNSKILSQCLGASVSKKVLSRSPHGKEKSEYLGRGRKPALGKYEIKAGWLISAVLEQQLNSDLPGLIRALVRENVYDSATGRYILLPAGSTLVRNK